MNKVKNLSFNQAERCGRKRCTERCRVLSHLLHFYMLPKLAASCVNESMNNVRNSLEHCVTKHWFKRSRWWLIHVFPSGLTKAVYAYCRDRAVLRTHTRILALTHLYSPEADTGSYTCLCPSCAKMARLRSSGLTRFAHVSVWESLLAW